MLEKFVTLRALLLLVFGAIRIVLLVPGSCLAWLGQVEGLEVLVRTGEAVVVKYRTFFLFLFFFLFIFRFSSLQRLIGTI